MVRSSRDWFIAAVLVACFAPSAVAQGDPVELDPDGESTSPANQWGTFGTPPFLENNSGTPHDGDLSYLFTRNDGAVGREEMTDYTVPPTACIVKVRAYVVARCQNKPKDDAINIGIRNGSTDDYAGSSASSGTVGDIFPLKEYVEYWEEWLVAPGGSWDVNSLQVIFKYKEIDKKRIFVTAVRIELTIETSVPTAPTGLTTEGLTNPGSVEDASAEFTAVYHDPRPGDVADKFRIQVSTDSTFASVSHWDSGAAGTSMAGTSEGSSCSDLPYAGSELMWGETYFWRIKFWDECGIEGDWSTEPAQFTMADPGTTLPNGGGSAWQMVGIPSGISVPTSALSGISGPYYSWDEVARTWVTATMFQPGEGVFVSAAATSVSLSQGTAVWGEYAVASLTSTELSAPTGMESTANALAGWQMVANVYNGELDWDAAIETAPSSSNLETTYWKWNGTQYVSYNASTNTGPAGGSVPKFQAVWVHVIPLGSTASLTLKEPGTWGSPNVPTPFDANWWLLQVSATAASGAIRDDYNWVGVHALSNDEWDVRDASDPGTLTWPSVILEIDNSDWKDQPGPYSQDVRKTPYGAGDSISWTLKVKVSPKPMDVTLAWPNIDKMSADWAYTLDDGTTFLSLDSATDHTYTQTVSEKLWTLTAVRLVDGYGTLEIQPGPMTPKPQQIDAGATVTMLQLELIAAAEDIRVDSLVASTVGTATAKAIRFYHDLEGNGLVDATDPSITSLVVASGTSEFVLVDFEEVNGAPGAQTHAMVEPGIWTGVGLTTLTTVTGNGPLIEGADMTLPPADPSGARISAGGGGSGSLSCSVGSMKSESAPHLGASALLVLLFVLGGSLLRRV